MTAEGGLSRADTIALLQAEIAVSRSVSIEKAGATVFSSFNEESPQT
jgi:hypothetical protein